MNARRARGAASGGRIEGSGSGSDSEVDVGRLIGLVGPGAVALLVLFSVTYATAAILSTPGSTLDPRMLAGIALTVGAAAIVTIGGPTPIPWWRVGVVWVVVLADVPLASWAVPIDQPMDYTGWYINASSFLCFALALRGRLLGAWIGMALALTAQMCWSVVATGSVWRGLETNYTQPIVLLAGTIFAVGLHRAARRILALQAAESRLATEEALAEAQVRVRRERVARIREEAGPLLAAIAEGRATPADRLESGLVEAALRDEVRGGRLAVEPIAAAARAARRRGVEVVLLDDAPAEVDPTALERARTRVASLLGPIDEGEVTVRLSDGDGVSVWVSGAGLEERLDVARE
ncbi:MAG: hypothetical protein J0G30_07625 [Actinomycetales bacterium]|nr:hypothetical protein [Actinomycetales bacterium]